MAGSIDPRPLGFSPEALRCLFPARSPGSLGINDAGDPTVLDCLGDTPGPVGVNDLAAELEYPPPTDDPPQSAQDATSVTLEQLSQIVSAGAAKNALDQVNGAMKAAGINTPARKAAFLAQIAEESQGLTKLSENGSDAYFTSRYDPGTSAGNNVGNTIKGDGPRFKGRGMIQLTGRENYTRAWIYFKLPVTAHPKDKRYWAGVDPDNPDIVSQPEWSIKMTAWYWSVRHQLNPISDRLEASENERSTFVELTRAINGGTYGLAERIDYYLKAKTALGITWGNIKPEPHTTRRRKKKRVSRRKK